VAREKLVVVANPEGIEAAFERMTRAKELTRKNPQPHQITAIEAWEHAGRRGILEHATGSGKTYTAILAMRSWLRARRVALVVVPSEILLHQWQSEIGAELADLSPQLLLVGAGNDRWRQEDVLEGFSRVEGGPRIILGMLQTVSSPLFLNRLAEGSHLLLVADEVHRVGSPKFSSLLSIDAAARLGLSATPVRYGDPDGSSKILSYFGPVLQPPFTLADAIAAGRLCHYNYYVHAIHLEEQEVQEWRKLTKQIARDIAQSRAGLNDNPLSERARLLLIQRARILKGAAQKILLARDVVARAFEDGQRWLIYCDDQRQLGAVMKTITELGLPAEEYHSSMLGHRQATLDKFAVFGGILVAIRCLDEGVDIPATDHALILASSRNPREFIQRRGRVLRTSPGKFFAEVHDALVTPLFETEEPDSVSILKGELARAVQFAESASNDAVKFQLRQLARDAGIDPEGIVSTAGFEEEEDGE
jgi:superfamily II DNA or RNA helicase